MAKLNERTLRMMESFLELREKGYSIREIAEKFQLSVSTVYKHIPDIVAMYGVDKETLLERSFFADHSGRHFTPVKPIDRKGFQKKYEKMMASINAFQAEIEAAITNIEEVI